MEAIGSIGIGGLVGFVLGLAVMTWVEPNSTGGKLLIIIVCIALGIIIPSVFRFLRRIFRRRDFPGL